MVCGAWAKGVTRGQNRTTDTLFQRHDPEAVRGILRDVQHLILIAGVAGADDLRFFRYTCRDVPVRMTRVLATGRNRIGVAGDQRTGRRQR